MADLLFEIGAEEIPAGMVPPAVQQLQEDLAKALADARLACGEVEAMGTPRRLVVWAEGVAARQADARTQALGPPVAQAFDAEGKPTQAALGFARSQGVAVEALERAATPKGERLAVTKVEKGRKAEAVLPALLERLVAGLRFKKAMRSRWDEVTFARPLRWMVALYGGKLLKVRFGEVTSGKATFGHRFLAPKAIALKGTSADYVQKLRKAFVEVDPRERRIAIQSALAQAAHKVKGVVRPDEPLLEQVTYLVEHPTAVLGTFEKSNLELPPEVVISEMRNHQRYFAVLDGAGKLTTSFIAVSGTPVKNPRVARHGYERVLRARLADARFFFEEDKKRALRARYNDDLPRRTYHAKLGNEQERTNRLLAVAVALGESLAWSRERLDDLREAGYSCKADLSTGMVGEFPELQGIMGGHYARLEGFKPEVADAIEDHYRPLGASVDMPRNDLGAALAIADRIHALVGLMAVGEKTTGGADPFGLRRAAIGILRILVDRGWHISLKALIDSAIGTLTGKLGSQTTAVSAQALDFLRGRIRAQWSEEQPVDLVEAVLAAGFDDLVDARKRLEALAGLRGRPDFQPLAVAFKRVANIQEKAPAGGTAAVEAGLLQDEAEKALFGELTRVEGEAAALRAGRDWSGVLRAVATLKPAVDAFFDDVLVMAEDPRLRANRLGLMRRVGALFADVADFRKIQVEAVAT